MTKKVLQFCENRQIVYWHLASGHVECYDKNKRLSNVVYRAGLDKKRPEITGYREDIKMAKKMGGSGAMTIHDVARELGVSGSTVSRAISGKGRIGKETREKILDYISKNGFYPNASAQSLAQSRTYNIAVILPQVEDMVDMPFFHTCMFGVGEVTLANEYDMMVLITTGRDTRQLERLINNHKVDGMILTRTYQEDNFARFLKGNQMPFVTIGSLKDSEVIQVDHNHFEACRELTGILLSKGMKRIAYLGGDTAQVVNQNRYEGYVHAYLDTGSEVENAIVYKDLESQMTIERAAMELVRENVDCILCQDDTICDIVMAKLKKEKVRVPSQIRVASCYSSSFLERCPVPVTALKFDIMELGRKACQILINHIEGKEVPMKTLLEYEVVLKESTK